MKFRTERKALAESLTWVSQAIAKIPPKPVLAGVRITADHGGLTLSGFDWHTSHEARVAADTHDEGQVVVSAAYLRSIVAAISAQMIEMTVEGNELVITGNRATYRTRLMAADEYPDIPGQPETIGTMDAETFAAAVAAIRPAVDDRPPSDDLIAISGLHLETGDDGLELVGTNRFIVISGVVDWTGGDLQATPPGKELEAAIRGMSGTLSIGRDGGVLGISDGTKSVTLRLISEDHPFPPAWRKLLRPQVEDTFEVTVDRDELLGILTAAATLTNNTVSLMASETEIEVATTQDEASLGSGTDYIPAKSTGEGSALFLPRRLRDGLAAMPAGDVSLGVASEIKPYVIRPADRADRCAVVMPIRPTR